MTSFAPLRTIVFAALTGILLTSACFAAEPKPDIAIKTNAIDVSVTLDRMEAFVADIREGMAGVTRPICVIFGHLGDGNLHVMLGSEDPAAFDYAAMEVLLYGTVERYAGSVSAEHGIGLAKRAQLHCSRSAEEIALMLALKRMLDPHNILNPGKVFSAEAVQQ